MTEDVPWAIRFESRAERDLARLDPPVARRVVAALDRVLQRDPSVDLRRLRGSDEWRLRVGDWRVRLQLDFDARPSSASASFRVAGPTTADVRWLP